jgi:hypothetical protein
VGEHGVLHGSRICIGSTANSSSHSSRVKACWMGYTLQAVGTICYFEVFCTAVVSTSRRQTCCRRRVTAWTTPNAKMSPLPVKFASPLPAFQAARAAISGESGPHCRKKKLTLKAS